MKVQKIYPRKNSVFPFSMRVPGVLLLMLFALGLVFAGDHISASISGNTVNYSVSGVAPDSDYKMTFKNLLNNQKEDESGHSDDKGQFSGSHTMASGISPGTIMCVSLRDMEGNILDFEHVTKPIPPKQKGAPWWAYTGIGTAIYLIF